MNIVESVQATKETTKKQTKIRIAGLPFSNSAKKKNNGKTITEKGTVGNVRRECPVISLENNE